jgi:hypothetical protein
MTGLGIWAVLSLICSFLAVSCPQVIASASEKFDGFATA